MALRALGSLKLVICSGEYLNGRGQRGGGDADMALGGSVDAP